MRVESVTVPVFPLPDTVFFPQTRLPLHVFEPRYRAMVRDASAGEGIIAVTLLRPGHEEEYDERPPYFSVGTLGHIEQINKLDDGRFLIRLAGTDTVTLRRIPSGTPYQLATVDPRPEVSPRETPEQLERNKVELLAAHSLLVRELARSGPGPIAVDPALSFAAALNRVCSELPVDAALRQSLLEERELRVRLDRVARWVHEALESVMSLRTPESDAPGPPGLLN